MSDLVSIITPCYNSNHAFSVNNKVANHAEVSYNYSEGGKRKKVLLITSRLSYPPIGGGKLKSYNVLKILSKNHDVHLVIISDETLDEKSKVELGRFTKSLKVFAKKKCLYLRGIKFLFNNLPIQVNYYYFNDVQKYIDEISIDVDFAISTLVRTSKYLKNFNKLKYLDMVDSIALNYKNSKDNVTSLFWKCIYKIETDRLLDYEKTCVKEFNNTFFVNKFEAEYWSKYGQTTYIQNGVDEKLLIYTKKNKRYSNCVAFFGKMDYQPNIDAVLWFVDNVLDKITKSIKFIIVGTKPTKKIIKLSSKYKNIEVTGFIDDPYEILNSALLVIAPMQTGGGMQNKILESMALGTINIVSSLGAKPIIDAENNKHLLISDDANEISKLINRIYNGVGNYSHIKINSKKLIAQIYTWNTYEVNLMKMMAKDAHIHTP